MHPMLNIAIQAIRQAGNFISKQYEIFQINNLKSIEFKNNLFIIINKKANQLISNTIKKYYPLHTIIMQNENNQIQKNKDIHWIINPIDSKINFFKNFPYFALSISVKIKGRTEVAVIYDPIHNDLFSASRGQGTQLNGYRIHNDIINKILYKRAVITYFSYNKQKNNIFNLLNKINKTQQQIDFRHTGSIILDSAYVAVGRIDALIAIDLKIHNYDSGLLLIQEAGGLVVNLNKKKNSNPHTYENIIAGHPKIVDSIIKNIPIT